MDPDLDPQHCTENGSVPDPYVLGPLGPDPYGNYLYGSGSFYQGIVKHKN
jgi:hypothetical protein